MKKKTVNRPSSKKPGTDQSKETKPDRDETFPGYPHYPETQDIYNQRIEKTELNDSEEVKTKIPVTAPPVEETVTDLEQLVESGEPPLPSDVTEEEKRILDSDHLNAIGGDDDILRRRQYPVDMSAADLDIPGTDLDDESEIIGEEDEENNSYSLGGDRHEDLEENRS